MIKYKKLSFINYMHDVMKYNNSISTLNDQWDNLKLLSEINCPNQSKETIPHMTSIQEGFYSLQHELIDTLIEEELKKANQKITSKAQVAIDILIRNLYERTADVGFLATDSDIIDFLSLVEPSQTDRDNIRQRLREYVAKYSVYDEIIILDKNCTVLANLDSENQIQGQRIKDKILDDTLTTSKDFVESFQVSKLQTNKRISHIFSKKIADKVTGETVGILCLSFRFDDEMQQIFSKLSHDYDGSVLAIIDTENKVVASSDTNHVPIDAIVESSMSDIKDITYYRGLPYISCTASTQGYQGYMGIGWRGHILLPLQLAFNNNQDMNSINSDAAKELMKKADSFSTVLREIIDKTDQINSTLRQIVYNGQIISDDGSFNDEYIRLKPILNAIGKAGTKTSTLFKESVTNLFSTVVSASLIHTCFTASLCTDIMDRNLYERANDCRWWALNPTFRRVIAQAEISSNDVKDLTKKLVYINSLYTVYTNLFLFDKSGKIIAVSNPEYSDRIGKQLSKSYTKNITEIDSAQKYYVTPFKPTEYYKNKPTYTYGASITDPSNSKRSVGGIGIIFDSEYQFKTMLKEALNNRDNSFAVFTDRKKSIISSYGCDLNVGDKLSLPSSFFNIDNGLAQYDIVSYEGSYYSVGVACSSSYREYKSVDGYENDVLAFVFEKLADIDSEISASEIKIKIEQSDISLQENEKHLKFALFMINGEVYAIDKSAVYEAIEMVKITKTPGNFKSILGVVEYKNTFIAVPNISHLFKSKQSCENAAHMLVVKGPEQQPIALPVDKLINVVEVNESDINDFSLSFIEGVICVPSINQNLLIINLNKLSEDIDSKTVFKELESAISTIENTKQKS